MHAELTAKVMKAAASSSRERRADAGPFLNILSVALLSPFHAESDIHPSARDCFRRRSREPSAHPRVEPGTRRVATGHNREDGRS
jgi:hypothetical protein